MKKYFNLNTKQVREIDDKFFELMTDKNNWIDNDIVENKIVIVSINDYRVFPKDELGFNRSEILALLPYFKPATEEVANKIAKYYKVCPYCQEEIKDEDKVLVLDCRGEFSNIRKMQMDVYFEAFCCGCHYEVAFDKTKSVLSKAQYINDNVYSKELTLIKYTIDSYDILIDIRRFTKLDFSKFTLRGAYDEFMRENKGKDNAVKEATLRNLDDFHILYEIFKQNLYLAVRENGEILEHPDTRKILNLYLDRR